MIERRAGKSKNEREREREERERERERESQTPRHGSENQIKKNELARMGIELRTFGLALRCSNRELWIAAAEESGNGNFVGSAIITNLNVVV